MRWWVTADRRRPRAWQSSMGDAVGSIPPTAPQPSLRYGSAAASAAQPQGRARFPKAATSVKVAKSLSAGLGTAAAKNWPAQGVLGAGVATGAAGASWLGVAEAVGDAGRVSPLRASARIAAVGDVGRTAVAAGAGAIVVGVAAGDAT